jgi:hypothetical protein
MTTVRGNFFKIQNEESRMRPQQQNRRMRGRNNNGGGGGGSNNNNNNNNNNRKGPNPLTRNYESNGPDVKIRGSAQQIAEKYTTLARDAQSSGDRVVAESYLQHAEHYNRIIAAAQAQMPIQNVQANRDDMDDDTYEDRDDFDGQGNGNGQNETPQPRNNEGQQQRGNETHQHRNNDQQRGNEAYQQRGNEQRGNDMSSQPLNNGSGPQPVIEGTPAEVALNVDAATGNNGSGRHRDRRPNRGPRVPHNAQPTDSLGMVAPDNAPVATHDAPAPGVVENSPAVAAQSEPVLAPQGEEATAAPRRARRPRRSRAEIDADNEAGGSSESSVENSAGGTVLATVEN